MRLITPPQHFLVRGNAISFNDKEKLTTKCDKTDVHKVPIQRPNPKNQIKRSKIKPSRANKLKRN